LVIGILVVKCVYGPFWCSPLRTFRHTQAQSHWNLCTNLIHQQVVPSWQLEIFYGLLLQKNMYVIAGISHRNGLLRNDSKERLTLELVPLCYVRHQSFGQDTLWLWAIPFNVPPPHGWIFLMGDYIPWHPLISAIFLRGKVKIYKFLRGVSVGTFIFFA
jgi:hypothetical protein